MSKKMFFTLSLLVLASMVLSACGPYLKTNGTYGWNFGFGVPEDAANLSALGGSAPQQPAEEDGSQIIVEEDAAGASYHVKVTIDGDVVFDKDMPADQPYMHGPEISSAIREGKKVVVQATASIPLVVNDGGLNPRFNWSADGMIHQFEPKQAGDSSGFAIRPLEEACSTGEPWAESLQCE